MNKKMTLAEYDDLEYSETADYWREKADRRLELLIRAYALIDDTDLIIPPHIEDVAYNLYKDIEKELSSETKERR